MQSVQIPNFVIDSTLLEKHDNAPALYLNNSQTIVIGFDTALGFHGYENMVLGCSIILNHEYVHHLLNVLEGPETSHLYDKIIIQLTDFEFNRPYLEATGPYAIPIMEGSP